MSTGQFPSWKPKPASDSLRRRIFQPSSENAESARLREPWIRVCLVVTSVWLCAVTIAWSPAVATVVPDSGNRAAGISTLIAQNCLPVASFTVTNLPILPSTNASQGTL
jgi:hypothetical protein